MVKCRDCKWWHRLNDLGIYGECDIAECPVKKAGQMITFWDMSCIHGERADGLKECCETCRHGIDIGITNYYARCAKDYFDLNGNGDGVKFEMNKMTCSEWQSREAKG